MSEHSAQTTDQTCACAGDVQETPPRRGSPVALFIIGAVLWVIAYSSIKPLADWLVFSAMSIDPETHLGAALAFFVYDTPKVLLLLVAAVFGIGVIRSWVTPQRVRAMLAGRRTFVGALMAAGLGVLTPFCSCSAVPLFIGFVTAGVPLGVTFSFLIASPMVNEIALAMLFGLFGWKVAALYLVTGLAVAVVAGLIIGRLKLEGWLEEWVQKLTAQEVNRETEKYSIGERILMGWQAVKEIVGSVWPYVVVGIMIGAGIHGFVPEGMLAGIMGKGAWWAVPLAVVIGIPMYSNAAGIIPVVAALMGKGAALGTVLAFMMSVIALSLPEMIILRKVLTVKLIAVFIGVTGTGILIVGYVFNLLL